MSFFNKIRKYAVRRAFAYCTIVVLCRLRGLFCKFILSDNSPNIQKSRVLQPTLFVGKGTIKIRGANLGVWPSPALFGNLGYIEARSESAVVEIESSTFINNSFVIISDKTEVKIGERCLIGPNFFVTDSDFHGLDLENRCNGNYECASVVIKDDVFIGDNVRILKGVKVGHGAVIGSGSVVLTDVEPMSVYAGVPARKVKNLI